jgi:ADP-ribose pyrophosphatase
MKTPTFELKTIEEDGQTTNFLEMPDTCICLYKNSEDEILFVRQYRPIFKDFFLELPGGSNEKHESLEATALREFKEETGLTASRITLVISIILSIGSTSEKAHIYDVIEIDEKSTPQSEVGVEVVWLKLSDINSMIKNGLIVDAKTIVALKGLT